jgi:hypothetical protein
MKLIIHKIRNTLTSKAALVFAVIIVLLTVFTTCTNSNEKLKITDNHGEQFAGSISCKKCHADIYNSFIHTAHYTTSRPGEKEYIKGSFERDSNMLFYTYYDRVIMQDTDNGLYQASFYKNNMKQAEKIDVVIGSGTRGQSYLYWKHNLLYQLPVSYFTPAHSWVNSPGNGAAILFNRIVYSRCMECHSTYLKTINNSVEVFDKTQIIYGVTCESCHGTAEKHVQYHLKNPQVKHAKFIINPGLLTRQQQLDQCALCHSGTKENIQPAFSFRPGNTLAEFYVEKNKLDSAASADVHGNKYNLLIASKCFKKSTTMTCATCHDTHKNERGNIALFSEKCMSCHNEANSNFCKMAPELGAVIKQNCIDCHMPKMPSSVLSVYIPEKAETVAAVIRQHFIKVYPAETKKVTDYLKTINKKQHGN